MSLSCPEVDSLIADELALSGTRVVCRVLCSTLRRCDCALAKARSRVSAPFFTPCAIAIGYGPNRLENVSLSLCLSHLLSSFHLSVLLRCTQTQIHIHKNIHRRKGAFHLRSLQSRDENIFACRLLAREQNQSYMLFHSFDNRKKISKNKNKLQNSIAKNYKKKNPKMLEPI